MQIYLMRHGDAVDQTSPEVTSDEARWLTDEGRAETATTAKLLKQLGVTLDLVLSSPMVRARQTAEIVVEELGSGATIELTEELKYGGSFAAILDMIASHESPEEVLVTGHMPDIGSLVGFLAWNQRECGIRMRTAGVCRIDLPGDRIAPGFGDIRWLLPPKTSSKLLGA